MLDQFDAFQGKRQLTVKRRGKTVCGVSLHLRITPLLPPHLEYRTLSKIPQWR